LFNQPVLCSIYLSLALIAIIFFRVFNAGDFFGANEKDFFLPVYKKRLIFIQAFLDWISFFPALVMSALVMPFGLNPDYEPSGKRFSPKFLIRLRPSIMTVMAAAGLFAILTFMIQPLLENRLYKMQSDSKTYQSSLKRAEAFAQNGDWNAAAGYFSVCMNIWPEKTEKIKELENFIRAGSETLLYRKSAGDSPERGVMEFGIQGEKQPLNPSQAVFASEKALDEGRFYDAHWLANLALRLSKSGSAEAYSASRIASAAWNKISEVETDGMEDKLKRLYTQKRSGYEAASGGDWIRAYYNFSELLSIAPDDKDVQKYYALSLEGIKQTAFFIDEIEGKEDGGIENVIFSIPRLTEGGRFVIHADYFTSFSGASYADQIEIAAFNGRNESAFKVSSSFAKIIGVNVNGKNRCAVLLRALDRKSDKFEWAPLWTDGEETAPGGYQILLDIDYEDFLLASEGAYETKGFFLSDFWEASKRLKPYGYASEVFEAEIIRSVNRALSFMPLSIFAIVIGWRFRSKKRPVFSGFPMAFILPVIFNALFNLVLSSTQNLCIIIIIYMGFSAAVTAALIVTVALFVISFLALAAQRE
jgi:hypothetical protein